MHINGRAIGSVALGVLVLCGSMGVFHFGSLSTASALSSVNGKIAFASSRDGNFEIYTMDSDGTNEARLTNSDATDLSPAWSPNGTKIAFVRGDGIHVMDADGKNIKRLTRVGLNSSNPSWSPNGTQILFSAVTDGSDRDIYVIDAAGGKVQDITNNNATDDFEPAWSPEGDKIAFTSRINASNFGIFLMNLNGTDRTSISGNRSSMQAGWSPDGTKIAFTGLGDRGPDIYIMDRDGSNAVRLTRGSSEEANPFWSPDGKKILFTATHSAREQVYIMNSDGTDAKRLTKNTSRDLSPEFQPLDVPAKESLPILRDNGMIVFTSIRNDTSPELYVMNSNGSNATQLLNSVNVKDSQARWSPGGDKIAYVSSREGLHEIVIINSNGTARSIVHQNAAPFAGLDWSPEADKLVFSKGDPYHRWIHVVNTDGSGLKRLSETDTIDSNPRWSPDGNKIAFARDFGEGNIEIYVMNKDGSNQKKITNHPSADNYPEWAPEADQIAFVTNRDGNDEIYVMNAEGKALKNLTNNTATDLFPSWSPDGSKIIFVSDRDQDGQDIYIMDSDGKNSERLTTRDGIESEPDFGPLTEEPAPDLPEIIEETETAMMPLNASSPLLRTVNSSSLDGILIGEEVVITATLTNEHPDKSWNVTAVVQVRDGNGVTRHLGLIEGLVAAGSNVEVGSSWTPDEAGSFELLIFVINSTKDPQVLSASTSSFVTISDAQ
jgi:Tol biopolymer transport system component